MLCIVTPYQKQVKQGGYITEGKSSRYETLKTEAPNVFDGALGTWCKVLETPWWDGESKLMKRPTLMYTPINM